MNTTELEKKVTICITTRDRDGELADTLHRLHALGLQDIRLIIVDDGSQTKIPSCWLAEFRNAILIREAHPLGLVTERNRMASLVDTEYWISLDDDSSFVSTDGLQEAIKFCDDHPDVVVLAFRITEPAKGGPLAGQESFGRDKRSFIGCGFMARTEAFRELGGFRAFFVTRTEERDFTLRAYGRGFRVVSFPLVHVDHRISGIGRSNWRGRFYDSQNVILCWILNLPAPQAAFRVCRAIAGIILTAAFIGEMFPAILGILSGFTQAVVNRECREPISREAYARWCRASQ